MIALSLSLRSIRKRTVLAVLLAALRFLSFTIARAVFCFSSGMQAAAFDNTISDHLDTIQRA